MYAIDGDVYPGRSMSLYPVQPGMTIYLRFTLAYGKDIGGFVDDGAAYGSLRMSKILLIESSGKMTHWLC